MRKSDFKTSGGTEFLVDETIKYVSQFVDVFDFEGSMIKGVKNPSDGMVRIRLNIIIFQKTIGLFIL